MPSPKVSILVPNYNHASFLEKRLDSIFNQTFQDFEVILLDDCSTDNSVEVLNKYSRNEKVAHFTVNEVNTGSPFKQWQKGFELAKGEWIWIAESDDYADYTFLEKLLNFSKENNETPDLIYSQSNDVDEEGNFVENRIGYTENFTPNVWRNSFIIEGYEFVEKYLKVKCVIPNASAVLFKKTLLKEAVMNSGFLKMRICGDWYFWIRLLQQAKVGFYNEPLNSFRFHRNVTRNQRNYQKIFIRCSEEKTIRDYLNTTYKADQKEEAAVLYERWFKNNSISKLFSKEFYAVKLRSTSYYSYIKKFFEVHRTREKLLKKFRR
ncbi:glycosyltransferase family 2 protein [Flavobacterium sediminis]|uniref:Glycosyltransferase family 2 protein n=1 Tax=Flavobacterium sediminis TaxID=2201181 RepID=A0A2U8QS99_9FLAO|nr:glycosyltransferase [Flavobacterium sediminis]AWM13033.1 glycosyltransferase family 2 protein [Flavobacterium sediminis]